MIKVVLQSNPRHVCAVFELWNMPDRVAAGRRHCIVGGVGGRVGGSSVVHGTAVERKRPMATTSHQDYIDLPASITKLRAADHMPSAILALVSSLLARSMEEESCSVEVEWSGFAQLGKSGRRRF